MMDRGQVSYRASGTLQDADLPITTRENIVGHAHKLHLDIVGRVRMMEVSVHAVR